MHVEKIPITPAILQWARRSSNLAIEDVAVRMKKSPEVIRSWENGEDAPTYVQLERLAYKIYKRPIAVFFFPEPPESEDIGAVFRTLPQTEIRELSPSVVFIVRKAMSMQIRLSELCGGINPKEILITHAISATSDVRRVEMLAATARELLGIPIDDQYRFRSAAEAFDAWRLAIEGVGIFIFKDAFREDHVSGFCLNDKQFPIIYVNNSMSFTRQIFTLFHELAHLLSATGGIDKVVDDFLDVLSPEDQVIERFCNSFAGEFLVPKSNFIRQPESSDPSDICVNRLSKRYSVSREVIFRRMMEMGTITREQYQQRTSEWIKETKRNKASRSGGDFYRTRISYLGSTYLDLVFSNYYRNEITQVEMADYVGARVDTALALEATYSER
jgi:Zn-dependent peptidase ImmA (M78 family)/transcriptional regulator with XRE-family HTH domain